MEREKVNELYEKAFYATEDKTRTLYEFARLVELETLELAAKVCIDKAMKMENEASLADTEDDAISLRSSAWLITVCGEAIRNLKDNHDKE